MASNAKITKLISTTDDGEEGRLFLFMTVAGLSSAGFNSFGESNRGRTALAGSSINASLTKNTKFCDWNLIAGISSRLSLHVNCHRKFEGTTLHLNSRAF